ncbi:MAG: DEAD/DEAH box helicase [Promethearchaeota archaeon]
MPRLTPRDYQLNARDQVISRINDGFNKFLVYLPTGMGKTLISILIIQYLFDEGYFKDEDKVLFLVADRKLKHQLHDMASDAGLANYGNLFLLPEGQDYPARLVREHAAMSRFIFATPVLFINSIIARSKASQKLDKAILASIKLVIVDEVFDLIAQSYGKKRTIQESISYIKKSLDIDDYHAFIEEVAIQHDLSPKQVENILIKEFSPRYYRINKKFEPVLSILQILSPKPTKVFIGLTASFSHEAKREFLIECLGGKDSVAEIFPEGSDFENYRPSIQLKKIRVFDDFISKLDSLIQELKYQTLVIIKQAYMNATNLKHFPSDRILLFITDLLSKKETKEKIKKNLYKTLKDDARVQEMIRKYIASSSAYLLLTVARQKLLEGTLGDFLSFLKKIKNNFLLSNDKYLEILSLTQEKIDDYKVGNLLITEKDKKLLYWVKRFTAEGKKSLILCRFINTIKHLFTLLNDPAFGNVNAIMIHGKMDGIAQSKALKNFKVDPNVNALIASERLIEKGTDLPQSDVALYYGSTFSLERYEQSLGRLRSTKLNLKTAYTITYNLTVEAEKSAKRDSAFLELLQKSSKKNISIIKEIDLNDE